MKLLILILTLGFQTLASGSVALVSWGPIPTRFPEGTPKGFVDDFAGNPKQIKDIFCGPQSLIKIPMERCRFVSEDLPLSFFELEKKFSIEGIKSLESEVYSSLGLIKSSHAPHLILTIDAHGTQDLIISDQGRYKIESFLEMVKAVAQRFENENRNTLKVSVLFNTCFSGAMIDQIERWKQSELARHDIEILTASTSHNLTFGTVLWTSLEDHILAERSRRCDAYCSFKKIFQDKEAANKISKKAYQRKKFHSPHQVYSTSYGRLTDGDKRVFSHSDFVHVLKQLEKDSTYADKSKMLSYLESMIFSGNKRTFNISISQFHSLNKIFSDNIYVAGISSAFRQLMISFFKLNMPMHLKKEMFTNRDLQYVYLNDFYHLLDKNPSSFRSLDFLFKDYLRSFELGKLPPGNDLFFSFILNYLRANPELYDTKRLYGDIDKIAQMYRERPSLFLNFLHVNFEVYQSYLMRLLKEEDFSSYMNLTMHNHLSSELNIVLSDSDLALKFIMMASEKFSNSFQLNNVMKSIRFNLQKEELLSLIHSFLTTDKTREGIFLLTSSNAWSPIIEEFLWLHLENIKLNQEESFKYSAWKLLLERSDESADLMYERILSLEENNLSSLMNPTFLSFVNDKVSTSKKNELLNKIIDDRVLLERFILNGEISFLEDWDFLEQDGISRLSSKLIEVVKHNPDAVWSISTFLKKLHDHDIIIESMLSSANGLSPITSHRLFDELDGFIDSETRVVQDYRSSLR